MLGVPRDVTPANVKTAYRRLALQYHPDVCPDDPGAAQRFAYLAQAYEVLGNPNSRAAYDTALASPAEPPAVGHGLATAPLSSLIDSLFGARDRRPKNGRDRRYDLAVSFSEMALGETKTLTIPHYCPCEVCETRGFAPGSCPLICESCGGAGSVSKRSAIRTAIEYCERCTGRGYTCPEPCGTCHGRGEVAVAQKVGVTIPSNVKDGKIMVLRGLGEAGRDGARDGDCFVHVSVTPHPLLKRGDGFDIVLERPVPVLQAIVGGKIRVPTTAGPASVMLPAGSRDGVVLRMRNFGIKDPTSEKRGTQRVTIVHEMPAATDHGVVEELRAITQSAPAGVFPASATFERTMNTEPSDD